jgi:protein O-mannosyl-transferase
MGRNSSKNRSFLICLALILTTLAIFYQVYSFGFVNIDDPLYVSENSNIQAGITLKAVEWAFTTYYASFWHPLTWLSHMLDWRLFGSDAGGHHLTNLVLHIINTLLLFLILKQMTKAFWQSAFVAALFALHPLHVESVAWVSERKDVLSTFFWLLAMAAYLRYVRQPNAARYLLTLLTFALGLMAKPMLVTLPFVFLLLDYWPLNRISRFQRQIVYRLVLEKIPFMALSAVSSVIAFFAQRSGGAISQLIELGLKPRIFNALISYVKYMEKMVWPSRLAVFYPHPGPNVSVLYAGISAVLLLAVTILVFRFAANHRYLATGWLWYLGTLLPVIGLVQVGGHAMADRYSYITLTGLFIIIAWGLPDLLGKWPHRKIVLQASSLMVLSVLAVCAYFQQQYWEDTITLCEHALAVTDKNCKVHFIMADIFTKQDRLDEAIRHYTEALRIKPDYVDALNGLGIALFKAERTDEAVSCYQKALEINPHAAEPRANLGVILAARGEFEEAIRHYRIAMATMDTPRIHIDLGYALMNLGRLEDAAAEYEKILIAEPGNVEVHNNLGIVFSRQGRFDEAIQHFSRAVQLDPNCTAARNNLNRALAEKQKPRSTENVKK